MLWVCVEREEESRRRHAFVVFAGPCSFLLETSEVLDAPKPLQGQEYAQRHAACLILSALL